MMPMPQGGGLPALPGQPSTEEEERALGIRRPAYIPVTSDRPKRKIRSWRVVSGVLSVMLMCIATCGGVAFFGKDRISSALPQIIQTRLTPPTYDFSQVPATPASTPGPASKDVTNVILAATLDNNNVPIDITTHFKVNSFVNVVIRTRPLTAGETHTLSVRWFLNGIDVGIPESKTRVTLNDPAKPGAKFQLAYPQAGLGMVKVYWDRPAGEINDTPDDPHLAQTLYFAVEQPTPTPGANGTPTGSPNGTPNGTPSGSPTVAPTGTKTP
jgi:hypothetical protein